MIFCAKLAINCLQINITLFYFSFSQSHISCSWWQRFEKWRNFSWHWCLVQCRGLVLVLVLYTVTRFRQITKEKLQFILTNINIIPWVVLPQQIFPHGNFAVQNFSIQFLLIKLVYQLGQTDMVSDIQLLTQLQNLEVKVKLCPILKTKYKV